MIDWIADSRLNSTSAGIGESPASRQSANFSKICWSVSGRDGWPVARATGHPSRPLTDQQIFEKFADCLDAGDSPIPADVLFKRLSAIQSINARDLTAPALA